MQILIAMGVASAMIGFSYLLGKKVRNRVKDTPYECGMAPIGDARKSFSVKFYLVGMLFILFDIEASSSTPGSPSSESSACSPSWKCCSS